MEINKIFSFKKQVAFSSPQNLEILQKVIAPFLSRCNARKKISNGVGPSLAHFTPRSFKKIVREAHKEANC
jgi:hypothetical protein